MNGNNTPRAGKPVLRYPVAVEGKYDKIKLDSLFEGSFFVTNGFGIRNDAEKKAFFRRLADKSPIIIFTDSDHAGLMIRNYFRSILPADRQIHLYIPQVKGKEKRKSAPSKEGFLGVEGSDSELLRSIFAPYTEDGRETVGAGLRRIDLYERGYEGADGAAEKRRALCRRAGLPTNLSTAALLEALNLLFTAEELEKLL